MSARTVALPGTIMGKNLTRRFLKRDAACDKVASASKCTKSAWRVRHAPVSGGHVTGHDSTGITIVSAPILPTRASSTMITTTLKSTDPFKPLVDRPEPTLLAQQTDACVGRIDELLRGQKNGNGLWVLDIPPSHKKRLALLDSTASSAVLDAGMKGRHVTYTPLWRCPG